MTDFPTKLCCYNTVQTIIRTCPLFTAKLTIQSFFTVILFQAGYMIDNNVTPVIFTIKVTHL